MISAKTATWGSLDLGGNWCEFATIPSAFSNLHQMATGEIALVEMNFENRNWEGTSSIQRYPALCNGTYKSHLVNFQQIRLIPDRDYLAILGFVQP